MKSMPPKKKNYTKLDQIDHIIKRSDMYVGSTRLRDVDEYVARKGEEDSRYSIVRNTIKSSPGVLRIFVEPLSNAVDNVRNSRDAGIPCTKIKVSIDKETGETSVWNDGDVVPVEMHSEENCYVHSMIFGKLNTSSNYDDDEERFVSGRFGLGVKLTNVFSSKFSVEGCDPNTGKILTQTWTKNMRETEGPKVRNTKLTKGYTRVTWTPDFKLLNMAGYTQDIIELYSRYVIDAALLTAVTVYLNEDKISIKGLEQYSQLYNPISTDSLLIRTKTATVLVTPSKEYETVSFVNGVFTRLGGRHVEAWSEALFRPIVTKFNKPKRPHITIRDVKQFFHLFVVATVDKPEFSSQDKVFLESPNMEAEVKKNHTTAMGRWSIMDNIQDIIRGKEMAVLKTTERKKKFVKIEGLDAANKAGSKESYKCTLILCEGLSAKTYAVAGIEKGVYGMSGRDWFGIYPLRGKLKNVREASATSVANNAVISDLVKATGIRHNVDYTNDKNFATLMYGRIMFMTDADVDGIHIEGLLMNFFHTVCPSLLHRPQPYIVSMKTPIVRIFGSGKTGDKLFYDERRFKKWADSQKKKFSAKYYKGLGTTRPEDVPDTFGLKVVEYQHDDNTTLNMNKVFSKKRSGERKKWLEEYSEESGESLDDVGELSTMTISSFIDGELIKYSHANCKRSLPCLVDGLKESQRKILYAVKKRKLKFSGKSLKVAQLGGYVAEHTNYHHGEGNLYDTIVKLANEFPGTNNIPLLYRDGMFGTRLEGGKDAASARYIFTKMEALTHLIFREEDDILLERVIDDGDVVEPKFYVPIIPMILCNGCTVGIATGWSCSVPSYNPVDMIDAIRIWLENDGEIITEDPDDGTIVSMLPEYAPWYRGFTGAVVRQTPTKFITHGICKRVTGKSGVYEVTELPVGKWTADFKKECENHLIDKNLKSIRDCSTPTKVNFVLTEGGNGFACNERNLKLTTSINTTNMVLFDSQERLSRYESIDRILDAFCEVRYEYYVRRKKHMLRALEKELRHLGNKERFIREVMNKKLVIMNVPEEQVVEEMEKRKYDKEEDSYDYLLRLQVRTFTANKIKQLKDEIKSCETKLDTLKKTSEKDIWLRELDELEKEYLKWVQTIGSEKKKKKRH